jgi:cation diffusion facilitator family transporter
MADQIRRIETNQVSAAVRRVYYQAIYVALIGNGLLLAFKGVAAYLSTSSAIYADTANSASDLAYSLLMMVGLRFSLQPPDESHPHGHERVESLVTAAIGGFMAFAGYQAFANALSAWRGDRELAVEAWLMWVPIITGALKLGMYLRVRRLAESTGSPAILATAYDHLTDIYTSGVVLVGLVAAQFTVLWADPIAGMLVSIWIFYQASRVVLDGVGQLIGRRGSPELEQAAIAAIAAVPGVLGMDKVIIEHVGPGLRADIHIYVDGTTTLDEVHRISHAVRATVEALEGVDHAFVHVEPAEQR